MRTIQLFLADLKELLANREFASLRKALRQISPMDLAEGWDEFELEEQKVLFKLAPRQRALQLFEELDPEHQEELLGALRKEEVEELVEDLDPAETSRILRELPVPLVRQLESMLRRQGDKGEEVERYLKYPEESVGALMRTNFFSINPAWTCRQALDMMQRGVRLRLIETMYLDTLFVVDEEERLGGIVYLKELVVAPPEMAVAELMNPEPVELKPEMDQEEAAQIFNHYKFGSAPVVDSRRRLLGVVLDTDIVEVVEEETEEDLAKFSGTAAEEFEEEVTALASAWHRMPWMAVAGLGQLIVAAVIWGFEGSLSRLVALMTFIPLIAALGGNVGAQSAIIMVHAISSGELDEKDAFISVFRDLKVGLMLGLVASVIMVGVAYLFYGDRFGLLFSVVTGLGILISMSVAATLGALVPILFDRAGIDPATATGPLVTTLTDIIGTAAYLGIATWVLL
jgi:magnesium transporter